MALALFEQDVTDFSTQGLGILRDTQAASIIEKAQANGNTTYELSMTYTLNGYLSDRLVAGMLISYNGDSIFEIYQVDDDDRDMTRVVSAECLDYRVMKQPFYDGGHFDITATASAIVAEIAKRGRVASPFKLACDISTSIYYTGDFATVGDALGQLMKQVDGEVEHGTFTWSLLKRRGRDTDVVLRDDKNTDGVTIKSDYSDVINTMIPLTETGEGQNKTTIAGTPVKSNRTPFSYVRGKSVKMEDGETPSTFFERTGADLPAITVEVSVIGGLDLSMFDRVTVYNRTLGWNKTIDVIEVEVDPLNDLEPITGVKLGSVEHDLMTVIKQRVDQVQEESQSADAEQQEQITDTKEIAEDAKESSDKVSKQVEDQIEETKKVREDVDENKESIKKIVNQNSNGPIRLYDETGNIMSGVGPISKIAWSQGVINSSGFSWGGKVIADNTGRFFADAIYGNTLESTTIKSGTIEGASITGKVYIRTGGKQTVVLSGDNGITVGDPQNGSGVQLTKNSLIVTGGGSIDVNGKGELRLHRLFLDGKMLYINPSGVLSVQDSKGDRNL